jgi:acetyl-CoA carboxylase biotin carboxyl carrier protein
MRGEPLADEANNNPRPFDVRTVDYLIQLMERHQLSEIDLQEGDGRIRLRRGGPIPATTVTIPTAVAPVHVPTPAPTANPAPTPARSNLIEIKSEAVGIFYAQREPGTPPFVSVGARVTETTVVCLIEAMKVYNEIQAGCSGVIREILVKDKEFVEYGTVLFRIDPAG